MPPKINPLRLNKLQLKTLTLLQELARHPETSTTDEETGEVTISNLPSPHGNHFHIGDYVAMSSDATGLRNEAVWLALHRKGLALSGYPIAIRLTPVGLQYDTGIRDRILLGGDH
jgi:hypothetical protein